MDDERVNGYSTSEIDLIYYKSFVNMVIFLSDELNKVDDGVHPYKAGLSALQTRRLRSTGILKYGWDGEQRVWGVSSRALEIIKGS